MMGDAETLVGDEMEPDREALRRLADIIGRLRTPRQYRLRPVRDESELRATWRFELGLYGAQGQVSWETFLGCWRRFPGGFLVMRDEADAIIASVELFPVKESVFHDLMLGKRSEDEIESSSLCRQGSPAPMRYWYVSGITIAEGSRRPRIIADFMSSFVRHLLSAMNTDDVTLCGLASSDYGERVLQKFTCTKQREAHEMPDGWPLYVLRARSAADLEAAFPRGIRAGHRQAGRA